MRTIQRMVWRDVLAAITFVAAGFLALFFFFDFVDELGNLGKGPGGGWQMAQAAAYVGLLLPNRLYELLPIAVLIGTIYVLARLARSSEFTILRTSGLGPSRALAMLLGLGLIFVAITFAIGDYVAPESDRAAQLLKAQRLGKLTVGQTGAWLKQTKPDVSYAVNVGALSPEGDLRDVRLFETAPDGYLVSMTVSPRGRFDADGAWLLEQVERTEFGNRGAPTPRVEAKTLPTWRWNTDISQEMVSTALLKPDRMSAVSLFQYIRHLSANAQSSQRYEIEFWRKVFYPVSCLVMVVLALPFAYLHFRSGGIMGYVFVGVLIGISFFLLNNVFGYVGNLQNWRPWLTAAAPGMIYSVLSLGAFGWLVLRR